MENNNLEKKLQAIEDQAQKDLANLRSLGADPDDEKIEESRILSWKTQAEWDLLLGPRW